jgi:hypothetical protein
MLNLTHEGCEFNQKRCELKIFLYIYTHITWPLISGLQLACLWARVKQHPLWYLHILEWVLLVGPSNARLGLEENLILSKQVRLITFITLRSNFRRMLWGFFFYKSGILEIALSPCQVLI